MSVPGFRYLRAVTDARVRTLLKEGVLQTKLFDAHLCAVKHDDKHLIVHRNETVGCARSDGGQTSSPRSSR